MIGAADDRLLALSFALHSNPGVYALLLGSGVSKGAGIPTGWEIVVDLIRQVAAAAGEDPPNDPEGWYRKRFGERAEYTKVLGRLAATPAERRGLLRGYFEATEEEREQGLKVPTAAHRAIARLVNLGYVRLILTTNFDRLIETALADEGIVPDVISSDDDLRGAVPLVHSTRMVVKLHGDYRDTRIKNTSRELARYPKRLNEFLDRVFDEFGLIVCGWSAEWDVALREAIVRCPTRRFTTYWLARHDLGEDAQDLAQRRRAEVVKIESADTALATIVEKVESLRQLGRSHPVSTNVAVATVKRYVSEARFRIPLHDLFGEETGAVYAQLASERFTTHGGSVTKEEFQQRMREYESVTEKLAAMVAALSYHDEGADSQLLTRTVERLAHLPTSDGLTALLAFRLYPALLVTYVGGVAAIAGGRYGNLSAILRVPRHRDERRGAGNPAVDKINLSSVFLGGTAKWVPRENAEREYTAPSNYVHELLRAILRDYLPDDTEYDDVFDTFEYLLALTYTDLMSAELNSIFRSPIGRYGWRWKDDWGESPGPEFIRRGLKEGSNWGLLKSGFFSGSVERAKEVQQAHDAWLQRATADWW